MRRFSFVLLPVLVVLLCGAKTPVTVTTPQHTLNRLKRAVARKDRAGEWHTLSPAFKQRLSRRAGRNVDVGDYITVRNAQRNNPRIRTMEKWMNTARITSVRPDGRGGAQVTIRFGMPLFFGQSVRVGMIHHALWSLRIKGERQPYWGYENSKSMQAVKGKDGSYTVRSLDARGKVTWQQSFPKEKVLSFKRFTRWYFNDFGAMEQEFLSSLR